MRRAKRYGPILLATAVVLSIGAFAVARQFDSAASKQSDGATSSPTSSPPAAGPGGSAAFGERSPLPGERTPPPSTGEFTPAYYDRWRDGPPSDPTFFPIGVWLQDPNRQRDGRSNAVNYKNAGINTFVGQWEFPERADSLSRLATIRREGLQVLAGGEDGVGANAVRARSLPDATALTGFFIGDEQDMSTNPRHITPEEVTRQAKAVRAADSSRPIYNNWGKAFSLYPWVGSHDGRAGLVRYCSEIDISSSDYYAATDGYEPRNKHTPNFYGKAVDNLRRLCGPKKPAWGFVETGHPFRDNPGSWSPYSSNGTITAATVEQAVWSMLAHGANGIVYFVHDFYEDRFVEDGLFDHPKTLATVTRVNATIRGLAPLLNAQRQPKGLTAVNADATLRADANGWYVIAAENSGASRTATFTVAAAAGVEVEVVGENRRIRADANGRWVDRFAGWGHHVYRIPA